jgi:hypothetical protein
MKFNFSSIIKGIENGISNNKASGAARRRLMVQQLNRSVLATSRAVCEVILPHSL